jgi:hypothetical protein
VCSRKAILKRARYISWKEYAVTQLLNTFPAFKVAQHAKKMFVREAVIATSPPK